jgi:anti-anti-sigma factor
LYRQAGGAVIDIMFPPRRERLKIERVPSPASDHELRLEGELDLATAAPLRNSLRELDDGSVVLDLSGVTFTDSTGLATLIAEGYRAHRHGSSLRVRGATGQTRALLERTGALALLGDDA